MKTIRIKLFVIFSVFMVCLVLCGIFLNAAFLKKYYIIRNRSILLEKSRNIAKEYTRNVELITEYIHEIDRVEAIKCTITDKNMVPAYYSFPQQQTPDSKRLPAEIEQLIQQNESMLLHSYVYSVVNKKKSQVLQPPFRQTPPQSSPSQDGELILLFRLNTGEMVILTKSMKGISESVSIANQFYLLAGFLLIMLGGFVIFLFSKRIVNPVIEMSQIAENISNLDFSKRVNYESSDEIGNLAQSINHISEKLSKSMEALKMDVERRKQLVRNISHELKTPIGVIKGYTEGLKFGVAEDKEKAQKYCDVISSECDRMDALVLELLNISKLESGMFQLKISFFDLKDLIHKIIDRFDTILKENGITLILNLQEELSLTADYELIERLLNNYVTNAIHHASGKKEIQIDAKKIDNMIRITVKNTGKHIPDEDIKNIWDVFYKVDKARTREYKGHGLGLFIVELITSLHHGKKGVENTKDGVSFFVEIPDRYLEE